MVLQFIEFHKISKNVNLKVRQGTQLPYLSRKTVYSRAVSHLSKSLEYLKSLPCISDLIDAGQFTLYTILKTNRNFKIFDFI